MLLAAAADKVLGRGLTGWDWFRAGLIVGVAIVVAQALRHLVARMVRHDEDDLGGASVLGRIVGYVVVLGGFVYALSALDVKLGPLLGAIGIGGIALAFALQDTVENLIAGVLLQTRRPFRRGQLIATGQHEGIVEDVNLRVVQLRTPDGQRVYIPNSSVLKNPIVNYSARGARRTSLTVGLPFDVDLEKTKALVIEAVAAADGVRERPHPEAWVEEFGASAVSLTVQFWHAPHAIAVWRVRDAVAVAVKQALDDAGIDMPYPVVDVRSS